MEGVIRELITSRRHLPRHLESGCTQIRTRPRLGLVPGLDLDPDTSLDLDAQSGLLSRLGPGPRVRPDFDPDPGSDDCGFKVILPFKMPFSYS